MAPRDHRIPRIYKEGAKVLKEVLLSKRGLKDVIYSNRNKMLYKKLFVLLDKYLDNQNSVNTFIEESKLKENVRDEYILKILSTELLHGRKILPCIENNTMKIVNTAYEIYSQKNHTEDPFIKTDHHLDNSLSHFLTCKKKMRYVRVNTLMMSVKETIVQLTSDGFLQLPDAKSYDEYLNTISEYTGRTDFLDEYFIQDFHLSDVLLFLQSSQFHDYVLYKNGTLFLQDKASCIPSHLLSPCQNSIVFDTCAAPGNKTLHLAAYMQNTGTVYAVDKDPKRFKYMKEVIELAHGSQVVQPILSDIFEIKMADFSDVEYVLVDPSCSGTGITERAKIDNHQQMSAGRIKNLAGFQKDLLNRVCSYFPSVKRIVYCTCSVREEENEQVIEDIMSKHGDKYEVEDLRQHPILSGWKHFGNDNYEHGRKCFYALPEDFCTGFFAAVFNRRPNSESVGVREYCNDTECDGKNPTTEKVADALSNKRKKKSKKEHNIGTNELFKNVDTKIDSTYENKLFVSSNESKELQDAAPSCRKKCKRKEHELLNAMQSERPVSFNPIDDSRVKKKRKHDRKH